MPDDLFVKITLDLPFHERIRLGRVNTYSNRMSQLAISNTKEIDSTTESCRKMTPDAMRKIFNLCRERLEKGSVLVEMVDVFAEFAFPRLVELKIALGPDQGNDVFDEIMANHPKIKKLTWDVSDDSTPVRFAPTWVPMENLTNLKIIRCNSSILRKFVACRPNLTHFAAQLYDGDDVQGALEEFFACFSSLEECKIRLCGRSTFNFVTSPSFWQLNELKTLVIDRPHAPTDHFCTTFVWNVVECFPNLEVLIANRFRVNMFGMSALEEMQSRKLRDLALWDEDKDKPNDDEYDIIDVLDD